MKNELLLVESREKGKLIKSSIDIIEKLAKSNIADNDSEDESDELIEIKTLIVKARTLISDRWWDSL